MKNMILGFLIVYMDVIISFFLGQILVSENKYQNKKTLAKYRTIIYTLFKRIVTVQSGKT